MAFYSLASPKIPDFYAIRANDLGLLELLPPDTSSSISKEAATNLERAKEHQYVGGGIVTKEEEHLLGNIDEDDESVFLSDEENQFLKNLENTSVFRYVVRTNGENDIFRKYFRNCFMYCPHGLSEEEFLYEKADPIIKGMDIGEVKHYDYSDLWQITDKFNESNLISKIPFGRLFHSKLGEKDVLVKTWDPKVRAGHGQSTDTCRIADELRFLRYPTIKSHENVVNLIGYSCDKKLAVIYEATRPKHLLEDIIESDEFAWEDRLKVAFHIATVLKSFHDKGIVHRGLLPACFLIYEDFSVMSYDFNFDYLNNWPCRQFYLKPDHKPSIRNGPDDLPEGPELYRKEDVFAFGLLLMQMVCKEGRPFMAYGRWQDYLCSSQPNPPSPIHKSFNLEEEMLWRIKNLVLGCIKIDPYDARVDSDDTQLLIGDVVDILRELVDTMPVMKTDIN